jgi:ABC-type uncharacterized transport system permease subunit
MHSIPLFVTIALYGVSATLYMAYFAGLFDPLRNVARIALLCAGLCHLFAIGYHHANHLEPSILSVPSILNLGVFLMVAIYLVLVFLFRVSGAGGIIAPLAVVMLGVVLHNSKHAVHHLEPLPVVTPLHIVFSALGFVFFFVAFFFALLRVVLDLRLRERGGLGWPKLPPLERLDALIRRFVMIGFPFYTVGIVLGAVWSSCRTEGLVVVPEYLVGVVVWAVYASLLVRFRKRGWQGRRDAALVVIGFIGTLSIVLMYVVRRLVG